MRRTATVAVALVVNAAPGDAARAGTRRGPRANRLCCRHGVTNRLRARPWPLRHGQRDPDALPRVGGHDWRPLDRCLAFRLASKLNEERHGGRKVIDANADNVPSAGSSCWVWR